MTTLHLPGRHCITYEAVVQFTARGRVNQVHQFENGVHQDGVVIRSWPCPDTYEYSKPAFAARLIIKFTSRVFV